MQGRKTYFIDIDGTILYHAGSLRCQCNPTHTQSVLPGVYDFFDKLYSTDAMIILTTGRPESARQITIQHLDEYGIHYDQLIMGLGRGARCVINDSKPDQLHKTALALTVERNKGLENVEI